MSHCSQCGQLNNRNLRKRQIRGGAIQYVYQCENCGYASNAIPHREAMSRMGGMEPQEFDPSVRQRYLQNQKETYQQQKSESRVEFFNWYSEYLKSPEWRAKRKRVLHRAQGLCEGCRERDATQVHHLTYENVGEEFLWQLVAICDECHDRYHELQKAKAERFRE